MSLHTMTSKACSTTASGAALSLLFAATVLAANNSRESSRTLENEPVITIGASQSCVNVMKTAKPVLPKFPALAPRKGFVRGYVRDRNGKPLVGAKLGVRATAVGGFYSGASTKTDANGYYEIKVPWGAAHFYCAGYTIDYGEGRAALGLHPVDGDAESFPSGNGHVENWVLLPYGVADKDGASEKPCSSLNYYGGSLFLDYQIADPRPLFADDYSLPSGAIIELTLTPEGPLIDGSTGRRFVVRKKVQEDSSTNNIILNNIPVGRYAIEGRLIQGEKSAPLRLVETGPNAGQSFGLEPKESRGKAQLTFRPDTAKAEMTIAQRGNWASLSVALKK